ncbi:phytanoyl-CoA dioxygenase family protein [Pseudomonas sp. JV414]|nr:phytanoyl-CoA dioxygenase family protein [Pseudomonas sp. JV414]
MHGAEMSELAAVYHQEGWIGPFPLLTQCEREKLSSDFDAVAARFAFPRKNWNTFSSEASVSIWYKSFHWSVESFNALVQRPEIVERVRGILGPKILAWGATVIEREARSVHPWHVDIEHSKSPGVSVHIALSGVTSDSSLNILPGSHLKPMSKVSQRRLARKDGVGGVPLPFKDGEFCILDGALWHGSHNKSSHMRRSILLQYSTPDYIPAIPLSWGAEPNWHTSSAPSLLLEPNADSVWMYSP